jgi:hypothetical protein
MLDFAADEVAMTKILSFFGAPSLAIWRRTKAKLRKAAYC